MGTIMALILICVYYAGSGGYYEKASAKNLSRDIADFQANRGDANYTYMGKLCDCNPGQWCAMFVSTCVYEACGNSWTAAKNAMWGVWPYLTCNQVFDAGLRHNASHYSWYQINVKGKAGAVYIPRIGDVIVFSDNGTDRTHTGIVYAVDDTYVYTYEGNSGNMVRKLSYALTSAYIYGYTTLNLSNADQDYVPSTPV